MQRFGGLLWLLFGVVALSGYLTLPPLPDDTTDFAFSTRTSIAPYHPEREDGTLAYAPASGAFRDVVNRDSGRVAVAPVNEASSGAWTTVVTVEPSRTAVLRSAKPGDARTRFEIARDLQTELKRAGCYGGEINGVWTTSTKRAMAAFVDRANAQLPIDTPDFILLSLVQSHSDIVCWAECPPGKVMNEPGRCVPSTVVAQAPKPTKPDNVRRVANARASANPRVAAAEPERLPWLDRDGRSIVRPTAPRAAPPPGMMSVGGPGIGAPPSRPLSQDVWIERDDASRANTGRIAALTSDDAQADVSTATEPERLAPPKIERPRRRARHSRDWQERPRSYGPKGRTRRGDPRPGSMRFNVVQVLGGIY
jgi:hypothetical protein